MSVIHMKRCSFKDLKHYFCLNWKMKRHWTRVNHVKREALLKDLHVTSAFSFRNANTNTCTSILIVMLKR